jgi:hypothetical protein
MEIVWLTMDTVHLYDTLISVKGCIESVENCHKPPINIGGHEEHEGVRKRLAYDTLGAFVFQDQFRFSKIPAAPMPPPTHIVTNP